MRRKKTIHAALTFLLGLLWLLPVVYLLNVALKPPEELYSVGVFTLVQQPTLANFSEAWNKVQGYLANSLLYVLV